MEIFDKWNFIEHHPGKSEGYKIESKTTTIYSDKEADTKTYTFNMPECEWRGTIYAYKLTKFKFPMLRSNGLSPTALAEVLNFDYTSKKMTSHTVGLINTINNESIQNGLICLKVIKLNETNGKIDSMLWSDAKEWCSVQKKTEIACPNIKLKDWNILIKPQKISESGIRFIVIETKSTWKMTKKYQLQDAYLIKIIFKGLSSTCTFNGLVSGAEKTRQKSSLDFVKSIGLSLDLK
jgi:hypothetical protein